MKATEYCQKWGKQVVQQVIGFHLGWVVGHSPACVGHYGKCEIAEIDPHSNATQKQYSADAGQAGLGEAASESSQDICDIVDETN